MWAPTFLPVSLVSQAGGGHLIQVGVDRNQFDPGTLGFPPPPVVHEYKDVQRQRGWTEVGRQQSRSPGHRLSPTVWHLSQDVCGLQVLYILGSLTIAMSLQMSRQGLWNTLGPSLFAMVIMVTMWVSIGPNNASVQSARASLAPHQEEREPVLCLGGGEAGSRGSSVLRSALTKGTLLPFPSCSAPAGPLRPALTRQHMPPVS